MLKERTELDINIDNIQQKIISEDRLSFKAQEKVGPTVELFFHELSYSPTLFQKIVSFIAKLILSYAFIASMPICTISIWLFSGRPIFEKTKVHGKRGIVFDQYNYATQFTNGEKEDFLFGRLIHKLGLYKLPSVINIWKGEMAVVGPACHSPEFCANWNIELSDFYKRFALKPGYFGIAQPVDDNSNQEQVASFLKQEFHYLLSPSFKKDLKFILIGPI